MALYEEVAWPRDAILMVAPFDAHLHGDSSSGRAGRCLWANHDVPAVWSVVWKGERWPVCAQHLGAFAVAELGPVVSTAPSLADRFEAYILGDVEILKRKGYNPNLFLGMVRDHTAVGATKRLLADPRHSSYGFQRLWEMGELERSVEFAACLRWFNPLFTEPELEEARSRLILHDFPMDERLSAREGSPPDWADQP